MMQIETAPLMDDLKSFFYKGFKEHAKEEMGTDGGISEEVVFLASEKGSPVGGVCVKLFWGALHIKYLYVDPNYRKKGVGKALMERAFEYDRKNNCPFATVETMNFQAVGFYKKLGFKEDFVRHGYAHKTSVHYLSKQLGA